MKKILLVLGIALVGLVGCGNKEAENGKTSQNQVKVEKEIAELKVGIQKGNLLPEFEYYDLNGSRFKSTDLKGKYVMLHFWATWCPPCKREMPEIEDLYQRSKNKNFELVAISVDRGGSSAKELVKEFMSSNGYSFTPYLDENSELGNMFLVRSIPTTFIINPDGVIVNKIVGAGTWTDFDVDLLD